MWNYEKCEKLQVQFQAIINIIELSFLIAVMKMRVISPFTIKKSISNNYLKAEKYEMSIPMFRKEMSP